MSTFTETFKFSAFAAAAWVIGVLILSSLVLGRAMTLETALSVFVISFLLTLALNLAISAIPL